MSAELIEKNLCENYLMNFLKWEIRLKFFMIYRSSTLKITFTAFLFVLTLWSSQVFASEVVINMPVAFKGINRSIIGIILPNSPNTSSQYTKRMKSKKLYKINGYVFLVGKIYGHYVVMLYSCPKPIGSVSVAIDLMEKTFHPIFVIDPGTAGSHLPDLSMGDVVIGARIVDFSNYMTTYDGKIEPGEFTPLISDHEGYDHLNPNPEYLYADPILVKLAAKAAQLVAKHTPALILNAPQGRKPWILVHGTQGGGEAWLRDPNLIKASTVIFHEDDEASVDDYSMAVVSYNNHIPLIEVHSISDAAINVPTEMNEYFHRCSEYAQRRSNLITLQMIKIIAHDNLSHADFISHNAFVDPWPLGTFNEAIKPPYYVVKWTNKYGIYR